MSPELRHRILGTAVSVALAGCSQAGAPTTDRDASPTPEAASAPATSSPEPLRLTGTIAFDRLEGGFGYESPYLGTYTIDASTSRESEVPFDLDVEGGLTPTWAPDGSSLLVNIFVWPDIPGRPATMSPDGSNRTIIQPDGMTSFLGCTAWSPDGAALLCTLDDDSHPESEGIYSIGLDGTDLTRITASPNPSVEGSVSSCGGNDFAPAYSPDGTQIAFLRAECGPGEDPSAGQQATLCVVRADGTGLAEIVGDRIPNSHGFSRVSWSPSGDRIVFGSEQGRLYLVKPDGTGLTEIELDLDTTDFFAYTPSWSPDGSVIVFSLVRNASTDLYAARPDGSNVTQITDAPGAEVWASWTP